MFRKVLVANRGEIACRVIRTLRSMGIGAVAVCSEADRHALHVRMADDVRVLGPSESRQSYLRFDRILDAAKATGAEAIHPGYGFLSESESLRAACDDAGIVFIGPTAHAMRVMGLKTAARQAMAAAGVPIVPGITSPIDDPDVGLDQAREVGFPVLLKASAGGGGKGMRLVLRAEDFRDAFVGCSREALAAFGDGAVYFERAILRPRHIEVQVLSDRHGNTVHVFDRECSVQRRHQKVIEESPAVGLSADTRARMGAVAVAAARAIGYEGAGTIEFLVDEHEHFYFLEMNTRLQVEHPVTEMVVGLDLVREQVRIAAGEPLGYDQAALSQRGHAIECRLYAEDPHQGFMPSPGPLLRYVAPSGPGIRVDDGVREGDIITPFYDPMIGKIIAWGSDRSEAIARMRAALAELRVGGIRTNRDLLSHVLETPAFVAGRYSTDLLADLELPPSRLEPDTARLLAAVAAVEQLRRRATPARNTAGTDEPSWWRRIGRVEGLR